MNASVADWMVWKMKRSLDPADIDTLLESACRCIWDVSSVVKALDRLEEIHTVTYAGSVKMIDIGESLAEQLRHKL